MEVMQEGETNAGEELGRGLRWVGCGGREGVGGMAFLPAASPTADCRPPYLEAATPRFDSGRVSRCQNMSAFKFISMFVIMKILNHRQETHAVPVESFFFFILLVNGKQS